MKRTLTILILAVAAGLASCGSGDASVVAAGTESARAGRDGAFVLHRPAMEVAHRGQRRVDVFDPEALPGTHLAYREVIETDGEDNFSLRVLEALTQVDPSWQILQQGREGFFFRYRDFQVRDRGLFHRNYRVTSLDEEVQVAGRTCERYRIERKFDAQRSYEVAVDVETRLVLAVEELDPRGTVLSSVVYESFETQPDHSQAIWFRPAQREGELDWRDDLGAQLDRPVHRPKLLPAGFQLRGAATVSDRQTDWLKLTYTDGVETLFFLTELPGSTGGAGADVQLARTSGKNGPAANDEVVLFELGAARAAQGTIGGRRYLAVGKVDEDALLDLIESALP